MAVVAVVEVVGVGGRGRTDYIGPIPSGDERRRGRDGWEKLQRWIGWCKALDRRTAAA